MQLNASNMALSEYFFIIFVLQIRYGVELNLHILHKA